MTSRMAQRRAGQRAPWAAAPTLSGAQSVAAATEGGPPVARPVAPPRPRPRPARPGRRRSTRPAAAVATGGPPRSTQPTLRARQTGRCAATRSGGPEGGRTSSRRIAAPSLRRPRDEPKGAAAGAGPPCGRRRRGRPGRPDPPQVARPETIGIPGRLRDPDGGDHRLPIGQGGRHRRQAKPRLGCRQEGQRPQRPGPPCTPLPRRGACGGSRRPRRWRGRPCARCGWPARPARRGRGPWPSTPGPRAPPRRPRRRLGLWLPGPLRLPRAPRRPPAPRRPDRPLRPLGAPRRHRDLAADAGDWPDDNTRAYADALQLSRRRGRPGPWPRARRAGQGPPRPRRPRRSG